MVDLGSLRGLIPREETALGIADGSAREIAILSRVGKPVCFQVLGFTSDGTVLLSRRAAQAEALDYFLEHLRPGDILPSVVQKMCIRDRSSAASLPPKARFTTPKTTGSSCLCPFPPRPFS